MNTTLRSAAAASLAVFAGAICSYGPSSAGTRTACEVLTGPQASGIIGTAVTAQPRRSPMPGNTVCFYMAGGHPIFQLGVSVMQTEAIAARLFNIQKHGDHKEIVFRQKGNTVLSAITTNNDPSKLNGLADAALKNL